MTALEILLTVLVGAVLVLALRYRAQAKASMTLPVLREAVALQEPVTPPPATPRPTPQPPADYVGVTFVSEKGKVLGQTRLPRKVRRPTMAFRVKGTLHTFVAQDGGGDAFRYRRVGTERES